MEAGGAKSMEARRVLRAWRQEGMNIFPCL